MKSTKKIVRTSNLQKHRKMISAALPEVRKLVAKYDLASVNAAIKSLYENRKAERELREA
jgi:hypothetical protein